jgi:hypothetical protein
MLTHVALMLYIVDMELRRAEPPDAIAVAHVRSWQAAYRKLMPDDYLDQLRINCVPRIERRNTILATSIPSGRTRC